MTARHPLRSVRGLALCAALGAATLLLALPARAQDRAAGRAVVEGACIGCHGSGVLGAPKIGDRAQWAARGKDLSALVRSAAAGTESAGLELVDVYLWIFKRLIDGKDMAPELMPLRFTICVGELTGSSSAAGAFSVGGSFKAFTVSVKFREAVSWPSLTVMVMTALPF